MRKLSETAEVVLLSVLAHNDLSGREVAFDTAEYQTKALQLEDAGYLTGSSEDADRYFEITDKGREYLDEEQTGRIETFNGAVRSTRVSPEVFSKLASGVRTFTSGTEDGAQIGDLLRVRKEGTQDLLYFEIVDVLRDPQWVKAGYRVVGLKPADPLL